jgi:hypothetical protein
MNELMEVLSVWWIKVVLDLTIVYWFLKIANNNKKNDYYDFKSKIDENIIQ